MVELVVVVRRIAPQVGTEASLVELTVGVRVYRQRNARGHLAFAGHQVTDHGGRDAEAVSGLLAALSGLDVSAEQWVWLLHG